jgi:hypothetical protein
MFTFSKSALSTQCFTFNIVTGTSKKLPLRRVIFYGFTAKTHLPISEKNTVASLQYSLILFPHPQMLEINIFRKSVH